MNRPSRGERESATTTRYAGLRLLPIRRSRIETAMPSPPHRGKARQFREPAHFPFESLELPHHLPELRVLLEQSIDVLHLRAAAARDALPARAVDHVRMPPFAGRHRQDDRVEAREIRLLADEVLVHPLGHLPHARNHAEELVERSHLLELRDLLTEVVQRERVFTQLLERFFGLLLIDDFLGLLDQREHVTHAEDAR